MTETKFHLQPQGYNVKELFSSFSFEVPIYQRVFTWEDEQFERLFKDLKEHFYSAEENGRYYLGVITVVRPTKGVNLILVDGQQRLTCILLLGAMLGWELDPGKLDYAARPEDRKALKDVYAVFEKDGDPSIGDISKIGNVAMAGFLRYALTHYEILQLLREKSENIKQQLTLMVSILPDEPYQKDIFEQNRYFEKMNCGGKQLEPHEILKVQMCKGLEVGYLGTWNLVKDFGKCIEVAKGGDGMLAGKSCYSLSYALHDECPESDNGSLLSRVYERCVDKSQLQQYELGIEERDDLRRGLISFPMFLLHVRALFLKKKKGKMGGSIGDESRLLDVFRDLIELPEEERRCFIDIMKCYRRFLDLNVIHIVAVEGDFRYCFYDAKNGSRDAALDEERAMMQFQSMLYVSSGPDQKWLLDAYEAYCRNSDTLGLDSLKQLLRQEKDGLLDNVVRETILGTPDDKCLSYGTENRRWFALLDYLLWERLYNKDDDLWELLKCEKFALRKREISSAIRNFVFRRNRSVEHLHAQTDANATASGEWEKDKDIFGNLALISAGRNSEYGNLSVGGKFDRVDKLLKEGGDHGSRIESIKLMFMLAKCNGIDAKWTVTMARQHATEMLKLFKQFLAADSVPFGADSNTECRHIDLSGGLDALGVFIEKHFFDGIATGKYSITVVRKDDQNWDNIIHDEEVSNRWCGRYFKIGCSGSDVTAFVGWFYGGGNGGTYTTRPRFVVQIDKNVMPDFLALNSSEWYEGGDGWMSKDLLGDLHDVESVAQEFKREIEALCTIK